MRIHINTTEVIEQLRVHPSYRDTTLEKAERVLSFYQDLQASFRMAPRYRADYGDLVAAWEVIVESFRTTGDWPRRSEVSDV